jgi:hypothetical protein
VRDRLIATRDGEQGTHRAQVFFRGSGSDRGRRTRRFRALGPEAEQKV